MKVIEKIHSIITGYHKEEVKGFEAWTVTWWARHSDLYYDKEMKAKVFIDKKAAEAFAESLHDAQKLLEYTEDIKITVEKQR